MRYAHLKNGQLHDLIVERKKNGSSPAISIADVSQTSCKTSSRPSSTSMKGTTALSISRTSSKTRRSSKSCSIWTSTRIRIKGTRKRADKEDIAELLTTSLCSYRWSKSRSVPKGPASPPTSRSPDATWSFYLIPPIAGSRARSKTAPPRSLKKLIRAFEMPKDMGLICRTASAIATPEMLIEEATRSSDDLEKIMDDSKSSTPHAALSPNRTSSSARHHRHRQTVRRLLIDDYHTYQAAKTYTR